MPGKSYSTSSLVFFCFVSVAIHRAESFLSARPQFGYPQDVSKSWMSQADQDTRAARTGKRNSGNGLPPKSKRKRPGQFNRKNQKGSPQANMQLNSKIVSQENSADVLSVVASTKGALTTVGGGGKLNSINFSTAIHRIAKYLAFAWQNPEGNDRSKILSDPRFALLICGASEALGGADVTDAHNDPLNFASREMSNMAWALAKLRIVPPKNVIPVDVTTNSKDRMNAKSKEVRAMVYEVAKQRASNGNVQNGAWIPALSELCGHLMDTISQRATLLDPKKFQLQEFSNLLWATATAKRSDESVVAFIVTSLIRGMEGNKKEASRPQEWSNSLWALATSGVMGPENELLPFVADLLDKNDDFADQFKPQELANTAWAIATILSKRVGEADGPECEAALRIIRHVARQLIKRDGQGYKSQEISNTVWSFATLGFGLQASSSSSDSGNEYTFLVSDDPGGDKTLVKDAMHVAIKKVKEDARRYKSQELNNFAWSMARLQCDSDHEVLEIISRQMAHPQRQVSPQDIGTTLWALATMGYDNVGVYRNIVRRVDRSKATGCKPQELSNVVWALATADVVPEHSDAFDTLLARKSRPSPAQAESDPLMVAILLASQELMRRPGDFKEQEIKDVLWSLSRMGVRHPALFKSVAEHLVGTNDGPEITGRGVEKFSPQGMGNLAWAFARQAQLGAEVMERRGRNTVTGSGVTGRLAQYSTICNDIGEFLLQKLFHAIAEADLKVHDNLSTLSPQDLSNTAWAFAIMGLRHERFLAQVAEQMDQRAQRFVAGNRRLSNFSGQELANALWALATLNYVRPALLDSIESFFLHNVGSSSSPTLSVTSIAKYHRRQELANIAWVCTVFGQYPRKLVEALYMGLIGLGENTDPEYVKSIYKDDGIQSSGVMSLLYLQTLMDLEIKNEHSFSLPMDFPERFGSIKTLSSSSSNSNRGMVVESDSLELELTSSKTQLAVGAALDRIGFDHIQEHIIDMATLSNDHGVSIAPVSKEVFSLDMAQVDSMIGIEFDGPGHFITNISNGPVAAKYESPVVLKNNGKMDTQFFWSEEHQEPNGPTAMKERILSQLGWKMVHIPFWQWFGLNEEEQEDYCRSKLE